MQARRRIRRLHRRLRPEFRRELLPDRASFERAIQECVAEVPMLEGLRRWAPRVRGWFAEAPWRRTLLANGYEPVAPRWQRATPPTVTLAPTIEAGGLRRALEFYLREVGVQVVSAAEQIRALGHERLEQLERLGRGADPGAALVAYLRDLGRRSDAVVLPASAEIGEAPGCVQWRAPEAAALPAVIAFPLASTRRGLRADLIELGELLTGDAARCERAFERAFALA